MVLSIIRNSLLLFIGLLYITFVISLSFGTMTAGVFTLIPAEFFRWTVSKSNYLGYYSVCSFAPCSTIILFSLSLVGFYLLVKLGKYIKKKRLQIRN